ncbi:UNVERIFIED_CONTAM: voltage-gated potassium channel [Acetivibrio alkalicellulosi]
MKKIIYEVCISILAIIAVGITFLDLVNKINIEDTIVLQLIDNVVLGIFIVDYFIRLLLSNEKKLYFKQNIFDLVAIIPFSSLFRVFRIFRLFRIIKMVKVTRLLKLSKLVVFFVRATKRLQSFLQTNGFIYSLYITFGTIILGATAIYTFERNYSINTFEDALWWSFVTTTTVGYGDISPETQSGRLVAVVLMIVGIGFLGMFTGTVATYFIRNKKTVEINENNIDLSGLDKEQLQQVNDFVNFLKSKQSEYL